MTDDRAFVEAFRLVAGGLRGRLSLPTGLVEAWEGFVDECAEGYDDNLDEFDNDVGIRDAVELVVTDDRLRDFPQMAWVHDRVRAADERFRALLQERELTSALPLPWWRLHPLRYAGAELVADLHARYGVRLDLPERGKSR